MRDIFVSGGTGYIGRALVPALVRRGHRVRALTRSRLGNDPDLVRGDALDAATFAGSIRPADTFLHMVGVAHPAPWKGAQFEAVDVASVRATLAAAKGAELSHLVYVSVAQPAPLMAAYIDARARCERWIADSGIPATFLRPWYVLGPGHRWAHLLRPFYAFAERVPAWREGALRLGLVTLPEMITALVWAIENPAEAGGVPRVVDVPRMRALSRPPTL